MALSDKMPSSGYKGATDVHVMSHNVESLIW